MKAWLEQNATITESLLDPEGNTSEYEDYDFLDEEFQDAL